MSVVRYPRILQTESSGAAIEMSKRTYFPCVVEDACPKCGRIESIDLSGESGDHYLSYPSTNRLAEVGFYHPDQDDDGPCDTEWTVTVIPRLTLEIAAP